MALLYGVLTLGLAASPSLAQSPFGPGGPLSGSENDPTSHGFGGVPGASAPSGPWVGNGATKSPDYNYMYQFPLPIPPVAVPEFSETVGGRTIDYYSVEIKPFQQQVYPNLGPANFIGYNGMAPGPTYMVERYHETIIRYLNHGNSSAAVHLHGSYTHSPWDGWAQDDIQINEWKDYYYPNSEPARPIWYHDHVDGNTSTDAYYGQSGVYTIYDPAEDVLGLPSGDYDVPLALSDKIYQANGELQSPDGNTFAFYGDIIQVNEQPWPYMSTEPRKYRLRFYDMSLSRPYDLYFADSDGNTIPFQVIASDSGLLSGPISTSDVLISMGERYEVVFDFGPYSGQNITLMNGLQVDVVNEYDNTDKVMMFVVGDSVSDDSNNGDVPSTLNGNIMWPTEHDTVDNVFTFQEGGEAQWTINGIDFNDVNNRVLARPEQNTVQRWQLVHGGAPVIHPVHIHLVNMQIVSRTGGSRGVLPYEAAGLKDVVLLEPGETAEVLAYFGPWNGLYMFHCHNLIHEDHAMMAAFNVTLLQQLGYDMNDTIGFANPTDPRFSAQEYSAQAFEPAAVSSAVASLASLNPYQLSTSTGGVVSATTTSASASSATAAITGRSWKA